MEYLNRIRPAVKSVSTAKKVIYTIAILLFGIILGLISKYLDGSAVNELPAWVGYFDITKFLGRFSFWVWIALILSVYSSSAWRAAINVFVFFLGMVTSYYCYSYFVLGFFPESYAMIWVGFTVISPLLAFICWYAKGEGKIAFVIATLSVAILFIFCFSFGWLYFQPKSLLDLLLFLSMAVIVRRKTMKQSLMMWAVGIALALPLHAILPFDL